MSTVALVLLMGVGPFATDTYIAALPALRESLRTSATVAQLTLTAFIVGLAVGQLLLGPVSDARGRRRMLLGGTAAFTVLSAVCAAAPTGPVLVVARLLQGIAAGTGVALGRAVVTDTFRGPAAAAKFGAISSVTFLAPVVAPAAGGVILAHGSWRAVFVALTALGVAMTVSVLVGVPETLPSGDRQASGLRTTAARMADLLRDWSFMQHVAVQCLATAGFFTYIGGSAFVLQTAFGMSPSGYTVLFASNATAMALGGLTFRLVVRRSGAARLRAAGLSLSALAATGLLAVAVVDLGSDPPLAAVWALLCAVVGGMGLTIPATTSLAQEAGRRSAGTASALQGGLVFFTGALMTPLTGILGYDSLLPMALSMTGFLVAAFTLMCTLGRGRTPAPTAP